MGLEMLGGGLVDVDFEQSAAAAPILKSIIYCPSSIVLPHTPHP